jgi:hypothetical protein
MKDESRTDESRLVLWDALVMSALTGLTSSWSPQMDEEQIAKAADAIAEAVLKLRDEKIKAMTEKEALG